MCTEVRRAAPLTRGLRTAWEVACWGHAEAAAGTGHWSSWGQARDPWPHTSVMFLTALHTLGVTSGDALGGGVFLGRCYGKTRSSWLSGGALRLNDKPWGSEWS